MTAPDAPDLNALISFARVVEAGSFTAAARRLGIPKSRISRQVAALERQLNVSLLQRSTRRLALTDIGRQYYAQCSALAEQADAAQQVIDQHTSEPSGLLRVSAPAALTQMRLAPLLARFLAEYPKVRLELSTSNREPDLIEEGIDVAIRVQVPPLADSSLVARPLGYSRRQIVASPGLLRTVTPPGTPSALAELPSLVLIAPGDTPSWRLRHIEGQHDEDLALLAPRLLTSDLATLREAALAGLGFALMPLEVCQHDIDRGALAVVLPDWQGTPGLIHALYLSRRGLLPSVRSLLDFLGAQFPRAGLAESMKA